MRTKLEVVRIIGPVRLVDIDTLQERDSDYWVNVELEDGRVTDMLREIAEERLGIYNDESIQPEAL